MLYGVCVCKDLRTKYFLEKISKKYTVINNFHSTYVRIMEYYEEYLEEKMLTYVGIESSYRDNAAMGGHPNKKYLVTS